MTSIQANKFSGAIYRPLHIREKNLAMPHTAFVDAAAQMLHIRRNQTRLPLLGVCVLKQPERKEKLPKDPAEIFEKFFGSMPVFQNSEVFKTAVQTHQTLLNSMHASLINKDTLYIQAKEPFKLGIDPDAEITKEEREQLDPDHPLLDDAQKPTLGKLNQFGTIPEFWWNHLKTKHCKVPSSGILLKKQNNEIHFLKGVSLINKVTLSPDQLSLHCFLFEKSLPWKADDILRVFIKMKPYAPSDSDKK